MAKAFATFLQINNAARGVPEYRIRFNKTAARLFDGVSRVQLAKTENYLVMIPAKDGVDGGFNVTRDKSLVPNISMTRLVKHDGFLHRDLFDGTRYAVKRGKSGDNRVYICLKEKVEDDG